MTQPSAQLLLPFRFNRQVTFDNFLAGENTEVIDVLRGLGKGERGEMVYLWGLEGSGRSHLLQAVCAEVSDAGKTPAYLPLADAKAMAPELLEDLDQLPMVCIDDIDAVAGNTQWEQALFGLYNRLQDSGRSLVITGRFNPASAPFALKDLGSRIAACTAWHIKPLSDDDKCLALQKRAEGLGLELPMEVAVFLLNRSPRDMHSLFELLSRLDTASLTEQRKLTVPFVKSSLGI